MNNQEFKEKIYEMLDKNHGDEIKKTIAEIKRTGKVNRKQYIIVTGACLTGSYDFCKKYNITEEGIELDKLRKILGSMFGAERFWKLIDEN